MQGEIEQAAFEFQQQVESGERVIVGVNAFEEEADERVELLHIDPEAERRQLERTARVRAERNAEEAAAALAAVREAARGDANLLPPMREALRARCTVGEICERAARGVGDVRRGAGAGLSASRRRSTSRARSRRRSPRRAAPRRR